MTVSGDYYLTNPGGDYDEDGDLDFDLTKINRVFLDNITLIGTEQPSYEELDLTFHGGSFSTSVIEGAGTGSATISNPSYWTDNSLTVGISSNVSISCNYDVTLLVHNFGNSSWTPQPTLKGVAYSIEPSLSTELSMYTYIGSDSVSIYENFTVLAYLPSDWENATVYDPFLNDETSQCIYSTGLLEIPTSLLDRLGWWQITLESPNYAKSVTPQIRITGSWFDSFLFRSGNLTRASVALGTQDQTPSISDPVNVTWYQPDESVWYSEAVSTGVAGVVDTTQTALSGSTTLAGEWTISAWWTNGTEVAFGLVLFDMYHTASLDVPDEYETISIDRGLVISNFVYYEDADNSDFLLDDSVTIEANWSGSVIPFTQDFVKNWWRGEFDTSLIEAGQHTVVINASRPYFDDVSVQFTVNCIFETTLDFTNAGGVPIERGINEVFTVQMDYDLLNGTGIDEASFDLSHSGPGGGLSWSNFNEVSNGHYSVDIVCNISATYPITITLNKTFNYEASDTFTLIIGETGTSLSILNGTADVVQFGENYTVVLEYLNSTGDGILGANLMVEVVTPSTGLNRSAFTPVGDGLYAITLTPDEVGSFSVLISASLLNHEIQYATFTITASGIPTVLTSLPSSVTIAADQTFSVQLRFQDENLNPISYENVTVVNLPSGLLISDVTALPGGLYNFTLTPLEINTFDILFRGSIENYQSSTAAFTLVVTEIPTHLTFEGDVSSVTAEFQDFYQLTVYYYRSDTPVPINVDGADITVFVQDPGLVINVDEFLGYYVITIRGEATGIWSLTISANKTNHYLSTKQLLFEVEAIDTSIEGSNPLEALLIGRPYDFTFSFIFDSNSSNIRGGTIVPTGSASDWVTYLELGSGQYSVNLTPQELGEHSVLLTFEKVGFESRSFRLTFEVSRVPLAVEVLQGLSGPENLESVVNVQITEEDTGDPVSGVEVFCFVLDSNGARITDYIALTETTTAGAYSGSIPMPVADGEYQLEITCEAANYVMNADFAVDLEPARDVVTMLWVTTTRYYPIMIGLFALCAGLVYRRSARKKRIRENKATLAIKHRFDDIKSLMGVIVLHKESGLPIYSKILRDGLEETVISAFITAITSFRGEFDIESSSEEWGLIPISDIVRVISTNKLVCAFITTGNPSPEQRERMISFAKTVGFIFDDTMDDVPIVVLDHHTTRQFNSLFEDLLDGQLLRTYKLDEVKKFPTTSCANERIARKHGEEFKLEELASEIASCGLEEGRVYKAIMDALENEFLVTTDDSPFATELLRAPDTISDEI